MTMDFKCDVLCWSVFMYSVSISARKKQVEMCIDSAVCANSVAIHRKC